MRVQRISLIFLFLFYLLVAGNAFANTNVTYSYDKAGRLTLADYGKYRILYKYDKNSNLLSKKIIDAGEKPLADIRINDSDGPLTVGAGDGLIISLSMASKGWENASADWWMVEVAPDGSISYYDFNNLGFAPCTSYLPPTYQGDLFDFSHVNLPGIYRNSPGKYTIFFGVDTVMNALIDLDRLYYDMVEVTVK